MARTADEIKREIDEANRIMQQDVKDYGENHQRVGQAKARIKQLDDELREVLANR